MPGNVLLLSGDSPEIRALTMTMEGEGWKLTRVSSSDAVLEALSKGPPMVALMASLKAPWQGLAGLFRQVRTLPRGARMPILLVGDRKTIGGDEAIKAASVWPADIYSEPVDMAVLGARLKAIPADGEEPPVRVQRAPTLDAIREAVRAHEAPSVQAPPVIPERGSLKQSTPARLLMILRKERATGCLNVLQELATVELYVKDGALVHFEGDGPWALGSWLVSQGKADRGRVAALGGENPRLERLISAGILAPHEGFEALGAVTAAWLRECASLRQGDYRWFQGQPAPAGAFPLDLRLHRLLLDSLIASPPVSFPLPEVLAAGIPVLTDDGKTAMEQWGLTPAELRVLRNVDSNRPVSTLLSDLGGADLERQRWVSALLIGLRDLGALSLRPPAGRGAPVPQRAPERAPAAPAPEKAPARVEDPRMRELLDELARLHASGDPFTMLGVTFETSDEDCRKAFSHLSKLYHPDRWFEAPADQRMAAEEIFRTLSQAWDEIGKPGSREAYKKGKAAGLTRPITEDDEARARIVVNQAELFMKNKNFARARELFEEAVRLNPLVLDYSVSMSWAGFMANPSDVDRSLIQLHPLIKKDVKNARAFYYLGVMLKAKGDAAQAEKAFDKALALKADLVDAERELRLIKMRREKDAEEAAAAQKRGFFDLFKKKG